MSRAIFITGTNTGVGKTIVTRAMVRALVNRGNKVRAIKPVESGAPRISGNLVPKDAAALKKASKYKGDLEDLYAYAFEPPVSPHLAASMAEESVEPGRLASFIERHRSENPLTFVEGAGGLLVPLCDTTLYADVVAASDLELIIVAPNVLGTINTTLLTIEVAKARGIPILGVILNRTPIADLGNAHAISKFGKVPVLGSFPDVSVLDDDTLADTAEQTTGLNQFEILGD